MRMNLEMQQQKNTRVEADKNKDIWRTSLEMEQLKKNTMVEADNKRPAHEGDDDELLDSFSSSFSSSGISNGSSLESDTFEEVTSPASSSSSSSSPDQVAADPLSDMSSLFQQLPIKRGLSKHYQGKSQSFTSLANVRSLEDLAKAENPYRKKMKSCRSYGGGLGESHRGKCSQNALSRQICKRGLNSSSRSWCSSLSAKRGIMKGMASRPPVPPHRSTTPISNQTALFA